MGRARLALPCRGRSFRLSGRLVRRLGQRYEQKLVPIPTTVELALMQLSSAQIQLAGMVAAGAPIESIPQMDCVEVPKSMVGRGE